MNVIIEVMMIVTQKIEDREVMRFLVTIIKMMNEKDIAIAIPWKALETNALSIAIEVQASQVYLAEVIEGASVFALVFISSTKPYHKSINGALISGGPQGATSTFPEICMYLSFLST